MHTYTITCQYVANVCVRVCELLFRFFNAQKSNFKRQKIIFNEHLYDYKYINVYMHVHMCVSVCCALMKHYFHFN